jgi:hypothetical protein
VRKYFQPIHCLPFYFWPSKPLYISLSYCHLLPTWFIVCKLVFVMNIAELLPSPSDGKMFIEIWTNQKQTSDSALVQSKGTKMMLATSEFVSRRKAVFISIQRSYSSPIYILFLLNLAFALKVIFELKKKCVFNASDLK